MRKMKKQIKDLEKWEVDFICNSAFCTIGCGNKCPLYAICAISDNPYEAIERYRKRKNPYKKDAVMERLIEF